MAFGLILLGPDSLVEEKKIIKEDEVGSTNWVFKGSTALQTAFEIVIVQRVPLI